METTNIAGNEESLKSEAYVKVQEAARQVHSTLLTNDYEVVMQLLEENPELKEKSMHYFLDQMNRDELLSRKELEEKVNKKYEIDKNIFLNEIDQMPLEKARELLSLGEDIPLNNDLVKQVLEKNPDTILKKLVIEQQKQTIKA